MQKREAMQCRSENMQCLLNADEGLVVQLPCRFEFDHETVVSHAYVLDSGHRQAGETSGQPIAESQRFDVSRQQKKDHVLGVGVTNSSGDVPGFPFCE